MAHVDPKNLSNFDKELMKIDDFQRFKQALLDKAMVIKRGNLQGHELKTARYKAQKWFTSWFYANIAMGNIVNFKVFRFVNDLVPDTIIAQFLENIAKATKRYTPPSFDSDSSDSDSQSPESESDSPRKIDYKKIEGKHYEPPSVMYEYGRMKLKISRNLEGYLRSKYSGPPENISAAIFMVGLRYQTIGFDNHYLSIPRSVVSRCIDFELFGSPFNTLYRDRYFSPFPEVETAFGSRGDFFSVPFPVEYDRFSFNPPFDEIVMEKAVDRLLIQMSVRPMTILCILPVWDPETQSKIGAPMFDDQGNTTNDFAKARRFVAFNKLTASPYVSERKVQMRDIDRPFFYDYLTQKNILPINVHLVIMSNGPPKITLKDVIAAWKEDDRA